MSTGAIIAIVVIALILLALVAFLLPRMRKNAQVRARERELGQRRERAVEQHRAEADERRQEAERAQQRAQMAETEAKRESAEAELREQRAQMHEKGMADHELIDDDERDRFAGTSASADKPAPMRDQDDRPMHEPGSAAAGSRDDANTEYEQGREDEARHRESRFARDDETARTDEPATRRD